MTFFFTAIFMFLVFWRPQDWLFPWLYGWNILDVIFYMALLAFLMELDTGRVKISKETPQVYMLVGLWVAAIMSHIAHTYFVGMIETIVPTFKICFFSALLFCVLDRTSHLRVVAFMFVAMACLMAVHVILQEQRGYGFAGSRPMYIMPHHGQPGHTRTLFFGIFEDPNDTAQMLATSIPFGFVLFKRNRFLNLVCGSAIAWLLVRGLMTTHSRGGQVALAAVGAVMVVRLFPARWFPTLMLALGIGALILCPFSAAFLDDSAHDRVVFWGEANWAFKTTPLFGVGAGLFSEYVSSDRAAHNAFVLCYTEMGVFGYWFWFGMLQLGVIGAWRTRSVLSKPKTIEQAWLREFAGLSIAAMVGFCASSYFLTRAFIYPMFFLFGLLGALPRIARGLLPEHPAIMDVKRDVFIWGTVGSLGSIVYIYVSILLLNIAFY